MRQVSAAASETLIVAGDFGATHKRLRAVTHTGGTREIAAEASEQATSIAEIRSYVRAFLGGLDHAPDAVVIGVPGRVSADRGAAAISYLGASGSVGLDDLLGEGTDARSFLNDVEAGAWGVMAPREERSILDIRTTADAQWPANGMAFSLIVPGTGVGVAFGTADGQVWASEGGNVLAALNPEDPVERRLAEPRDDQAWPAHRHTFDVLASGAGLYLIMVAVVSERGSEADRRLLRKTERVAEHLRGRMISELAAADPPSEAAKEAIAVFGRLLGRCSQAVSLTTLGAAVVLGGNVANANLGYLAPSLVEAFENHPRQRDFLRSVSLWLSTSATLNIDGAEAYAWSLLGQDRERA